MLRRAALALVVSLPLILSEKAVLDDEDLLPSYIRSIAYSQAHTMKQRYAAHPQDAKYGGSTAARWWTDNWDPSVRCLLDKRIGNHGDGGKYVCDPDILLESDECVVYSVGSFNQWDFETAFNTHYPQCRVFTFDHTIEASSSKPNGTQWFKKGLGEVDDESKKLLSLAGMAALTNVSFIDVLKIDCEGCEFEVFRDARTLEFLKSFVAQVQIEVHIGYGTLDGVAAIAQNLLDIGFRMFSKEPNLLAGPGTDTVEVALINSHQWLRRWEERGRRDRQERAAGGPGDAGEEAPAATVQ